MTRLFCLLFLLFGTAVCTNSESLSSYQKVLENPLTSYRKGHYRNVVEFFEKNPMKATTLELEYIWASSYLELREFQQAFQQFYQIDSKKLSEEYPHIFPFYMQKYMQSLIILDDPDLLTPEEEMKFLDNLALVDKDSPIRAELDQELFYILWTSKNYTAMMLLDNDNISPQGEAWLELTKHAQGQAYDVSTIIKSQQAFAQNKAYTNILKTLDPKNFRNISDLSNLIEMNLRVDEYRDKALEFAERHRDLTKDYEYYVQILARHKHLDGKRNEAANLLYNYLQENPKSSLDFYDYVYNYLVNIKKYELAATVSQKAYKNYQKRAYKEIPLGIEFNKNPRYVFSWYQNNFKDISQAQHLQVIRALIRTDMEIAEQAVDLGLSINKDSSEFILMHGLIKEHFNKKEDAYKSYLQLIFQSAFDYSGIVAKQKEKKMREEFRDYFEKTVDQVLQRIPKASLQDRLMLYKSFLIDDELAQYVDHKRLEKDQKAFNKLVYADLNKVKKIAILEEYPPALSNLAPETQQYIENTIKDTMKNDKNWHNTARYFYKYRDIFINSDIEGYLTFRLYFYIRDLYGYTYFPNYPKEIIDLVFPKPEFELIKLWSGGDEDFTYWMLASFMAESHFRKRVYSHVGAVGFAQVMPYTATDIKRWLKNPELSNYDFYDNMRMGVYYHKRMYDLMDGNVLLSLAAYNAGPGAVQRWRKKYDYLKDDYLLIEAMDYQETRNYVKIIQYNYGMYQLLNKYDLY